MRVSAAWVRPPPAPCYPRSSCGRKSLALKHVHVLTFAKVSMTITLTMNGKEITLEQGKTLLEVARENGRDIPTICFHDATTANGLCRICVVEVEGMRVLQPACLVQAAKDMKVQTRSEKVVRVRKTILEMLASTMDLSEATHIRSMMNEYGAEGNRFPDAERREVPSK